jgi:hypothetical protein
MPDGAIRIDMTRYHTPLLTDARLRGFAKVAYGDCADRHYVTPRAKELLREKNIGIIFE